MFLADISEFNAPLPKLTNWGKRIYDIGENKVGKIFLKDATAKLQNGTIGKTFGIAGSGKTIRKTPFALAGLGVAGYGAYRGKKMYDKYEPEIKTGLKLAKVYDSFKNKFNWGDN